jgi:anoctamin-8
MTQSVKAPVKAHSRFKDWEMFGSAGKLFSKKFANTSRFVVSSKVWMNTIPTRDCDVLIVFPPKTEDRILLWLLTRIRARVPELIVNVRYHRNTQVYGFYMTASYASLLKGAEDLGIKKPVKTEYGGGQKEFVFEDQEYFEGVDDHKTFLNSEQRQSIVKNMLESLRALEGEELHILPRNIQFLEGQLVVPILLSKGIVQKILPLHNTESLEHLRNHWVKAFFKFQPLEKNL